jgi:hypothetical protein
LKINLPLYSILLSNYLMPYWQVVEYVAGGANGLPGTERTFAPKVNAPSVDAPANNLPHEVAPVVITIVL